jgi:hypothetical protein
MTITELNQNAAAKVREILDRPAAEARELQSIHDFDPWDIFPALYGSYDSDFDDCAIDVLTELRDGEKRRDDLGAEMLREMLCVANLCDYGTSPRFCFPTSEFKALLPELIDKWCSYRNQHWAE